MSPAKPFRAPIGARSLLGLPFRLLRGLLVAVFVVLTALMRAFGSMQIEKPEPRSRVTQVSQKR